MFKVCETCHKLSLTASFIGLKCPACYAANERTKRAASKKAKAELKEMVADLQEKLAVKPTKEEKNG
jgi:hypothetical protein